jgi:PAS domain S-box-containing protein
MVNRKKTQNLFEAVTDVGWYQAILNTVIEALFLLDQEGIINALNPAAERLFGYQASELLGRSMSQLIPELLSSQRSDDADIITSVGVDIEHAGIRKDGSTLPLRLDLSEFSYNGELLHLALIRDDTANKMAQEMLQETLQQTQETLEALELEREVSEKHRSEIRAIINTSVDAMALVSTNGTFRGIDTQFSEFFAIQESQIKDRNWSEMIPLVGRIFENPSEVLELLANTAPDKELEFHTLLTQRWPQHRELDLISRPVTTRHGRHIGRLYNFRDVTHEREVDRMKTQFVSMVSHELRTPLTSIKGFTEMILDEDAGEINEEQREFLSIVEANADRLIALVNDLLDISRIESGRVQLKLEQADLNEMMTIVVATMDHLIEEKSQTLELNVDQDLPQVKLDRDRIIQVLTNLVSNAYKYTQEGGLIRLTIEQSGQFVRFAVADNGFGISEKDQEQLFTRFFRVDSALTRQIGGTGLGLNIVKTIIEMHGGEVAVDSELGVGSTFVFTIPLVSDGVDSEPVSDIETGAELRVSSGDWTVLVVEDDKDIALLIRSHLGKAGYTVVTAASGEDALAYLQASRQMPDLITLDIELPGINGFEFAARMAADPKMADIPILVISIYGDDPRRDKLGLVQTLAKPIDRSQLLNKVATMLGPADAGGKVLIIEDDVQSQAELRAALTQQGFEVLQATHGKTGLELANREQPGLILLGLRLPDMDGTSILHDLKQAPETAGIPVIIASSEGYQLSERARALALGAADFMTGPIDLDVLIEEVRLFILEEED